MHSNRTRWIFSILSNEWRDENLSLILFLLSLSRRTKQRCRQLGLTDPNLFRKTFGDFNLKLGESECKRLFGDLTVVP